MYNINSTSTSRYDSCDELKSTDSEGEGDQYNQHMLPWSKHGSLEGAYRRRHGSGDQHEGGYRSLERNPASSIVLPELRPSKYGSKRESTLEYNDSQYQMMPPPPPPETTMHLPGHHGGESDVDLPPPPPPLQGVNPYSYHEDPYSSHSHRLPTEDPQSMSHMNQAQQTYQGGGYPPPGQTDTPHWYESGIHSGAEQTNNPKPLRQQPPPRTPVYESPPTMSFVQQAPPVEQQTYSQVESQQQMTVTKFQSYVEVSKPFEMSDFYKYSEKLRKQRTVQSRQSKLEAVLSGDAIPSPQGPRSQGDGMHSTPAQSPHGVRYPPYPVASPSSPSMSPAGSGYSSPASGSIEQGQSSPHTAQRSSRSSSPYIPSSPNPGMYHGRAARGPAAQSYSSIQQTSSVYSSHSSHATHSSTSHMSYSQHNSYESPAHTPMTKQMVYQPPTPQTCLPVSPSSNSSTHTTPNR